ncbi:uroporphyrinogen decarboxylase family protein [Tichowtungia aerotolerans]|uniref:Uroporphyrinogen decarboxylase (URO-D) domain-containing protein n=1 Tax=Tichowtungia aerotolerans TaxID=2697043 RepID=A0A6P1MFJ9_9BACT|nr:uroporphyrinogen decarboxylase family protein [Tichowtungia aerotolerans]QHI70788.1 hypothetical protein GT409_15515 [Tichowtungia aerotolerans]
MTHRERFNSVMSYAPFDRVPCLYFGLWPETLERWQQEGLKGGILDVPEQVGLDPDFEQHMFSGHGIRTISPVGDVPEEVLEETADYMIRQTAIGSVEKIGRHGSSIHEYLDHALKPTRADWERFKSYLDPDDPRRWLAGHEQRIKDVNSRDGALAFYAGSLYGELRNWMGVVEISMLMYDDPELFQQIINDLADYFIAVNRPLLERVEFDLAYLFEDCCFNTGPLVGPDAVREFMLEPYRRMVNAYHDLGIKHILVDSDGKVDDLVPVWLDAGIDIIFPIEVGTWNGDACAFRSKYGQRIKMMGGVNKHVIPKDADAIRAELERFVPLVEEGGFIPIPDHRIPPDTSLEQFRIYVEIFRQIFG